MKPKKKRLYDDNYLKFGFTVIENIPQCVICFDTLSRKNKPLEFFERKLKVLKHQKTAVVQMFNVNEKSLLASYCVAFRVAKAEKPHTIAENLILPAALDTAEIMFGKQEVEKLKNIPLSENTIQRRISDMATDVRDQVIEKIKESTYVCKSNDWFGFIIRLKQVMPNACWMHCFLHRQALASKTLPQEYNEVLNINIKIVNCIKGKALQTRLFLIICEDMGSLHQNLLYHTEVRWLLKGKDFEVRAELLVYLQQVKSEYSKFIFDPKFLLKLAFLSDLFEHLNSLNKSLQGRDENVITAKEKIHGFTKKINLWSSSINQNKFN
ncbi:unnamed protein product [Brassicogethes aeneus]|uniref:SCAN domain-containing protein 3 n=1 Tax=Brassicogethes aeneus TaxID=1431903 RepID=A0A9P0BGK8_BRAAE|nr:unnamed protein product [Brassicogethes aeneus]